MAPASRKALVSGFSKLADSLANIAVPINRQGSVSVCSDARFVKRGGIQALALCVGRGWHGASPIRACPTILLAAGARSAQSVTSGAMPPAYGTDIAHPKPRICWRAPALGYIDSRRPASHTWRRRLIQTGTPGHVPPISAKIKIALNRPPDIACVCAAARAAQRQYRSSRAVRRADSVAG